MMTETSSKLSKQNTDSKRRILIVDDEAGVVKLLAEILRDAGYTCLGCHSSIEALHLISTQRFNMVLSDVHMPGIDGMELLRLVRREHPQLPVVMVTGEGDIRIGVQAMKEGAYDYLLKPLNLGAVIVSVKQVMERRQMEEELENYRLHLEDMVDQRTAQLRKAVARIEQNFEETLQALATALELRDNGTSGHSRRVMSYAVQIAKAMNCNKELIHSVTLGALLHDVGKIGIPDAILMKKQSLNPQERAVMQTHVIRGYNLLKCIAFLSDAAEIVLTHHERFDGMGYPQGLMGTEIPMGARIFAVADTLDVMTSDRPYHRATTFAAAREEIIRQSGKQFDPAVVSAFLSIDAGVWEGIRTGEPGATPWECPDMELSSPPFPADMLKSFEANA
jgi:putative nucleotidyltransferase with HDIG domain